MRTLAIWLSIGFLAWGALPVAMAAPTAPPLVVLDPGHGGEDPGAVAATGLTEKSVNLSVARDCGTYLKAHGVSVVYTRAGDHAAWSSGPFRVLPDLRYRAALPQIRHAQLFVSIHSNSEPTGTMFGPIVYYDIHNPASYPLAREMAPYLWRVGPPHWAPRPVEQLVLEKSRVPSVNVELGFLSNKRNAALLRQPWYQETLAQAIGRGIIHYLSVHPASPAALRPGP
ncbi:MAG: N-acetylmuramoyl-L-alanine amidase [Thermaerobacter sp.]|nr:N-acetylmuramoyl-L-alanine amidase [Thermaerobacter sp.]